jgi:condensin complex subunit 1
MNIERLWKSLINTFQPRFGMAEQAINTIYLLGEQPDVLCTSIIQELHRQAFPATSSPDVHQPVSEDGADNVSSRSATTAPSSPFKLAKLIFVVGHVAIKHIVYLELVEREFKRRKDEAAKGESLVHCSKNKEDH